mmetsp:Transcript_113260/g.259629  ORF Transcript_113260/g.259629 Transcript_113260/m.259629 type:complete len:208 (-) Transcript_113260:866-1489(-)
MTHRLTGRTPQGPRPHQPQPPRRRRRLPPLHQPCHHRVTLRTGVHLVLGQERVHHLGRLRRPRRHQPCDHRIPHRGGPGHERVNEGAQGWGLGVGVQGPKQHPDLLRGERVHRQEGQGQGRQRRRRGRRAQPGLGDAPALGRRRRRGQRARRTVAAARFGIRLPSRHVRLAGARRGGLSGLACGVLGLAGRRVRLARLGAWLPGKRS